MKKPRQGTWIIAGLSAALVIAVGGFVITQLPPPQTGAAADSSHGTSASQGSGGSEGSSSGQPGGKGGSTGPGKSGGAPVKNPPPTAGKRYTTEVAPPAPAAAPALPPSTGLPHLVTAPLPATASAKGALAAGFPGKALPPAPGSTISSSSVASQGAHLQITLVAKAAQGVADIVAYYRTTLAKYGMYDAAAPATAGSTAVAFTRGGDSLTITATPGSGGTSYVLYGAFTVTG